MSVTVDERVTDEVEALEAILMDDVVIKRVNDVPHIIETVVHPSTGDDVDQQFVCVTLEVKLTADYPDSSPEVTLRNPRGLDDELLSTINSQIREKLIDCLGQPVVFELIELIRENLTESNLPSGQCVICLYGFTEGDVFIKTKECFHHFHNHCLANHLIAGKKYYQEELEKLPAWQQMQAPSYQQTCPVCRCPVSCDVEALKQAPPPLESISAPPFCLTAELKALQLKMSALLAQQVAKGGVVGMGDIGPPPLTITSPSDNDNMVDMSRGDHNIRVNSGGGCMHVLLQMASTCRDDRSRRCRDDHGSDGEATNGSSSVSQDSAKVEAIGNVRPNGNSSNDNSSPGSPNGRPAYRGPYRGFNRRGKPGRRSRGGAAGGPR